MNPWQAISDGAKALTGAGAGLIGLGASIQGHLPAGVGSLLFWTGVVLVAAGLAYGGRNLATEYSRRGTARTVQRAAEQRVYRSYQCRSGHADDVDEVYDLGVSVVGAEYHITPTHMLELMKAADGVLRIVEKTPEGRPPELAGYFIVYPLKPSASQAILNGSIVSGFAIRAKHLTRSFDAPAGMYIAQAIGAKATLDRAAVLVYLRDAIRTVAASSPAFAHLFARPGTRDGQRWLENLQFTPVARPRSMIWVLERSGIRKGFLDSQRPPAKVTSGRG